MQGLAAWTVAVWLAMGWSDAKAPLSRGKGGGGWGDWDSPSVFGPGGSCKKDASSFQLLGAVRKRRVGLGGPTRLECEAATTLRRLGMPRPGEEGSELTPCWVKRVPRLASVEAGCSARPLLRRWELEETSGSLLLGGVQREDSGMLDCVLPLTKETKETEQTAVTEQTVVTKEPAVTKQTAVFSRVRLTVVGCETENNLCDSGGCVSGRTVGGLEWARCICSGQSEATGDRCEREKESVPRFWATVAPTVPFLVAVALVLLVAAVGMLAQSSRPKIGLGLLRGKNRHQEKESRAEEKAKEATRKRSKSNIVRDKEVVIAVPAPTPTPSTPSPAAPNNSPAKPA